MLLSINSTIKVPNYATMDDDEEEYLPSPPSSSRRSKGKRPTTSWPASPSQDNAIINYIVLDTEDEKDADPDHDPPEPESPCAAPAARNSLKRKRERSFSWEHKHRVAVYILYERFPHHRAHFESVFNAMFRSDILACGKILVNDKTIYSQHRERGKTQAWLRVTKSPLDAEEEREHGEIAREIARQLGIAASQTTTVQAATRTVQTATLTAQAATPTAQVATPTTIPSTPLSSSTPRSVRTVPRAMVRAIEQTMHRTDGPSGALLLSTSSEMSPSFNATLTEQQVADGARAVSKFAVPGYRCQPVSKEQAHPPLPALLYRTYSEKNTIGINGPRGFVAGCFQSNNDNLPPPPRHDDPRMMADVENHLNRNRFSSPFISVAADLFWVVRLAIRYALEGAKHVRISLINAEAIGADRAYFVPPYHEQLFNKRAFTNGAQRYRGTQERLVWAEIPPRAIVLDLSLREVYEHVSANAVMASAIQLDYIGRKGVSVANIRRQLKQAPCVMGLELAAGIARLLLSFGIGATHTPAPMIAKLVSDIVRGWEITLQKDSPARWKRLAAAFAYALTDVEREVDDARLGALETAFLCGLRSGLGKPNWQYSPELTGELQRKAARLGLDESSFPDVGCVGRATGEERRSAREVHVLIPGKRGTRDRVRY